MLNEQKLHFCDAKIAGLDNKAAAIFAGYSPATASAQGSRLAKNAEIIKQIEVKTHLISTGQEEMPSVAGGRAVLTSLPAQHHEARKYAGVPVRRAAQKVEEKVEDAFKRWRASEIEQLKELEQDAPFKKPEDFLSYMMNNPLAQNKDRIAAAKALQSQENAAVKGTGKKEAQKMKAEQAGKRFGTVAPPRLVANNK